MAKLFDKMFRSSKYQMDSLRELQDLEDEKATRSAMTMSDIMGSSGDKSGMYANASPVMTQQLTQLQQMMNSGDPTIEALAMDQYKEFIDKPAAPSVPNSYDEYTRTVPEGQDPDPKKYGNWLMSRSKAAGGIDTGGRVDIATIQKMGVKDAQGRIRPIQNFNLTGDNLSSNTGSDIREKGDQYIAMPSTSQMEASKVTEASERAYKELDDLLFQGLQMDDEGNKYDPIMGDDYDVSTAISQLEKGTAELMQTDDRLPLYTSMVQGIAGQLARGISGEKGALRDEDIQRAIKMVPVIPHIGADGIPRKGDTASVAKQKMRRMRRILKLPPSPKKKKRKGHVLQQGPDGNLIMVPVGD